MDIIQAVLPYSGDLDKQKLADLGYNNSDVLKWFKDTWGLTSKFNPMYLTFTVKISGTPVLELLHPRLSITPDKILNGLLNTYLKLFKFDSGNNSVLGPSIEYYYLPSKFKQKHCLVIPIDLQYKLWALGCLEKKPKRIIKWFVSKYGFSLEPETTKLTGYLSEGNIEVNKIVISSGNKSRTAYEYEIGTKPNYIEIILRLIGFFKSVNGIIEGPLDNVSYEEWT